MNEWVAEWETKVWMHKLAFMTTKDAIKKGVVVHINYWICFIFRKLSSFIKNNSHAVQVQISGFVLFLLWLLSSFFYVQLP